MRLLLHPMTMSRLKLPYQAFRSVLPVPVIRGLTRFLTMAEAAEVEDGVVIIDYVAIFHEEAKEAKATRISLNVGFRGLKNVL